MHLPTLSGGNETSRQGCISEISILLCPLAFPCATFNVHVWFLPKCHYSNITASVGVVCCGCTGPLGDDPELSICIYPHTWFIFGGCALCASAVWGRGKDRSCTEKLSFKKPSAGGKGVGGLLPLNLREKDCSGHGVVCLTLRVWTMFLFNALPNLQRGHRLFFLIMYKRLPIQSCMSYVPLGFPPTPSHGQGPSKDLAKLEEFHFGV